MIPPCPQCGQLTHGIVGTANGGVREICVPLRLRAFTTETPEGEGYTMNLYVVCELHARRRGFDWDHPASWPFWVPAGHPRGTKCDDCWRPTAWRHILKGLPV